MAINRIRKITFFFLFFLFLFLGSFCLYLGLGGRNSLVVANSHNSDIHKSQNSLSTTNNVLKTNELELPDKVYTFLAPNDLLVFKDLYLQEWYLYYFYIELVTPHNISKVQITIWDPDDKPFQVFESEMFFDPEYGRYFEIPYGTAKSGQYKISITTQSDYNFNLYIRITQGPKCLYDKIESQDLEDIVFYKVTRFDNGKYIDHDVELKTDTMYKCFIGRVSAISIEESNEVRMDYTIKDPDDIEFAIYSNMLMEDINGINLFPFGTAVEGTYELRIRIYCEVAYLNIAYLIVEDYAISEVIEANKTKPEPSEESSNKKTVLDQLTEKNNLASLPNDWLILAIIFTGGIAGLTVIGVKIYRLRTAVNLNFNE